MKLSKQALIVFHLVSKCQSTVVSTVLLTALLPFISPIRLSGDFYGINLPTANLELVARFFVRYPTYMDKVFLSVKVSCQQRPNNRQLIDKLVGGEQDF